MFKTILGWVIATQYEPGPYERSGPYYFGPDGPTAEINAAYVYPTATTAVTHRKTSEDKIFLIKISEPMAGGIEIIRQANLCSADTGNIDLFDIDRLFKYAVSDANALDKVYDGKIKTVFESANAPLAGNPSAFLRAQQSFIGDEQFSKSFNAHATDLIGRGMSLTGALQTYYECYFELIAERLYPGISSKAFVFDRDGFPVWSPDGNKPAFFQPAQGITL